MQIAPFDQCCADCNHRLDVQKGYDILLEALMNMLLDRRQLGRHMSRMITVRLRSFAACSGFG